MQPIFLHYLFLPFEYGTIQEYISSAWTYLPDADSCNRLMKGLNNFANLYEIVKIFISFISIAWNYFLSNSTTSGRFFSPPHKREVSSQASILTSPTSTKSADRTIRDINVNNSPGVCVYINQQITYVREAKSSTPSHADTRERKLRKEHAPSNRTAKASFAAPHQSRPYPSVTKCTEHTCA